ncbi:leucine-rich repeat-containing protein 71 isoform X2 [Pseudophryne corroboree]|uniref:leucine-rich repeat-containing protein 71 isoform X2 n=1 Tax=Pseudophryne corroboree TaxID=495146 RepID=UPI0030817CF1
MGKKADKGPRDRTLKDCTEEDLRHTGVGQQDKTLLTPEEYECTGILEQDFTELCSRSGYTEIPKVVARSHPPSTPVSEKHGLDDTDWASDTQAGHSNLSSLKPCIRVELESEDGRSVQEISIGGWKIDDKMMGIFAKCLPAVTSLHKISLWNVGLTDSTFSSFLAILQHCPNVRAVALEGNPLPNQSYCKLISDDLVLSHISLRNNQINDEGAQLISQAILNLKMTNKALSSLVLSYNHITDLGAGHIAQALRLNRSLLTLNLSSNQIGDQGALALAEVLGHFSLTHTEIVERRRLLLEKGTQEQPRSPPTSRPADSKSDRLANHASTTALDKADKNHAMKAKQSVTKKKDKEKEPQKKEDRSSVSNGTSGTPSVVTQPGPAKKEDPKTPKKQLVNPDQKSTRGKGVKSATKRAPLSEQEQVEPTEAANPLLEAAEFRHGKVFLPGNKVLISLNLSRNKIAEEGLKGFVAAMETQIQETKPIPGTKSHTGLMRLSVGVSTLYLPVQRVVSLDPKNNFPDECLTHARLQEIMLPRDPMKSSKSSEEEQPL